MPPRRHPRAQKKRPPSHSSLSPFRSPQHNTHSILHEAGLHEFEAALVMNLAPETADEALALVPSLALPPGRWDAHGGQAAAVEKVLADVAAYRAFD